MKNGKDHRATEEIVLHTPDLRGELSELFPGNAEIVVLRESRAGTTLLARLPARGTIEEHRHFGNVQHLVLSGEYESEGRVFKTGTYRVLPKAGNVPTITSRDGAVILIVYDPPDLS